MSLQVSKQARRTGVGQVIIVGVPPTKSCVAWSVSDVVVTADITPCSCPQRLQLGHFPGPVTFPNFLVLYEGHSF